MRKLLMVLMFFAMTGPSDADVLGTVPAKGGGFVYFSDDKPGECFGMLSAEARDVAGKLKWAGCWTLHGGTVVVLWADGPAEVVQFEAVKWREQDAAPAKAPVRLNT